MTDGRTSVDDKPSYEYCMETRKSATCHIYLKRKVNSVLLIAIKKLSQSFKIQNGKPPGRGVDCVCTAVSRCLGPVTGGSSQLLLEERPLLALARAGTWHFVPNL